MVFSPPPDYLYQTIHPITGVVTTYTKMIESDLSFARASASYSVFSADGGINPFAKGAAPVKIRTFKFTYIHPYLPGETFTTCRDALVTACLHGREMQFFVRCGDGSLRVGKGVANVSDMKENRDAMVMFQATIEFECVNPFLQDQYETGTLRWDNGLVWDVGHGIFNLTASAKLTGGTYTISHSGHTTIALNYYDGAEWVNAALANAGILFYATGGPPAGTLLGPFVQTPPVPLVLSAISPGVIAAPTFAPTGITGGTLALTTVQAGSAATPQTWDFTPNRFVLTSGAVSFTVVASGNASDREVIIQVLGPINPYYVYNLSLPGGLQGYMGFVMLEGLPDNRTYHEIDVGRQRIRKVSGNTVVSAWDKFYFPPGQDEWFRVDPGPNFISVQQAAPVLTGGFFRIQTKGHYL